MTKNNWTNEEMQFLKNNYPDNGLLFCYEGLKQKRTKFAIQAKVRFLKLKLSKERLSEKSRNNTINNSKSKLNSELFKSLNCPEIVYFLGFFWADGHISKSKNSIELSIHKRDGDDLKNMLYKIGNWKFDYSRKIYSRFRSHDRDTQSILKSLGYLYKSNSSPDIILSKIPKNLKFYWWRGYFDGDGHINKSRNFVCLASNKEQNWDFVKKSFVFDKPKIKIRICNYKGKSGQVIGCSCFCLTNFKDCKQFLDYIYKDCEKDLIGLSRKRKVYLEKYLNL